MSKVGKRRDVKLADPSKHYCDRCDKVFKKASNLKRHVSIHSDNRQLLYCSFCKAHFGSRESVRDHILQRHLDQVGMTVLLKGASCLFVTVVKHLVHAYKLSN